MNILLIKLSSMGDLIQALPALSDAQKHHPDIQFDWVVDEAFAEIPGWHPAVRDTITSAHRRWRKHIFNTDTRAELRSFRHALRNKPYSKIIDAQTNTKSAIVTALSRGEKHGPDGKSVREYPAHWAYHHRYKIDRQQLAIDRWRQLFAYVLQYPTPDSTPNFGLGNTEFSLQGFEAPTSDYLVFVHNASWASKYWPIKHWQSLLQRADQQGLKVLLPWGSLDERESAVAIAEQYANATVLPRLSLASIAALMRGSKGAICMDTGLAHLAAALGVRTLTMYGPTDPNLIGATGPNTVHLSVKNYSCMPCYKRECYYNGSHHENSACLKSIEAYEAWDQFVTS
ncbi:MAG: lipopolysaccharide heptosyltransferase I [Pseudomonadales bacterium]